MPQGKIHAQCKEVIALFRFIITDSILLLREFWQDGYQPSLVLFGEALKDFQSLMCLDVSST